MPSAFLYMLGAGAGSFGVFLLVWWVFLSRDDDTPWFPALIVGSVVMLIAAGTREVFMRRAWTRYLLEQDREKGASAEDRKHVSRRRELHSLLVRAVQKKCAEAETVATAAAHFSAYESCKDYQQQTEEALRSGGMSAETRAAMINGRERVGALQKHHSLSYTRESVRSLTNDARERVRYSDKIETARHALNVIGATLREYPGELELEQSVEVIQDFVASVKIGRWVELAERAAFKGQYVRSINRYRDALFYLSRETMSDDRRQEMADRIGREIELLRARLSTRKLATSLTSEEQNDAMPYEN